MPTKAGQLKLSDIRQGKTAWAVIVIPWTTDTKLTFNPERVTFEEAPYIGYGGQPYIHFTGALMTPVKNTITIEAYAYGLAEDPEIKELIKDGKPFADFRTYHRLFTTEKAARRYQARLGLQPVTREEFQALGKERTERNKARAAGLRANYLVAHQAGEIRTLADERLKNRSDQPATLDQRISERARVQREWNH